MQQGPKPIVLEALKASLQTPTPSLRPRQQYTIQLSNSPQLLWPRIFALFMQNRDTTKISVTRPHSLQWLYRDSTL